jgi:hypothetical protein
MNNTATPARTIQDIQMELIGLAKFNQLDGARIKQDLLANKDLWKGAILSMFERCPLFPLRDIHLNYWNGDTLLILPQPGKEAELMALASKWKAFEIDYREGDDIREMYGGGENKVLRLWWE